MTNTITIDAVLVDKVSGAVGKMRNSWTEFNAVLQVGAAVGRTIQGVYDATVKKTMAYADSVRALTDVSSASAQQASRFIQVLDDYQITAQDALTATKALTKQGHEPTLETLAKLSTEYNTLTSEQAKNEFILKNLGKAGLEWARVLGLGEAAILKLSEGVDKKLVLDQKALDQAEELRLAQDELADAQQAWATEVGTTWIPIITDVITLSVRQNELVDEGTSLWQARVQAARENIAADEDLTTSTLDNMYAMEAQSRALEAATVNQNLLAEAIRDTSAENQGMFGLIKDIQGEMDGYNEKLAKTVEQYGEGSEAVLQLEADHKQAMEAIAVQLLITKLSADGLTDAEFQIGLNAMLAAGVVDQAAVDMATSYNNAANAQVQGFVTVNQAASTNIPPITGMLYDMEQQIMGDKFQIDSLRGQISMLDGMQAYVDIYIRQHGSIPRANGTSWTPSQGQVNYHVTPGSGNADGGQYVIPPTGGRESFNMGQLGTAQGGEVVTISNPKKGQVPPGGGGITNAQIDRLASAIANKMAMVMG